MKLISTGAEAKLIEYLASNKEIMNDSVVVVFHFSQLLEYYRSEYQIKIATNLISDLLKNQEGLICLFDDANLMVVGHNIPKMLMEKVIFQLRYLFMDDPLAYTHDGHENEDFCHVFVMRDSYEDVCAMVRKKMLSNRKTPLPTATPTKKDKAGESLLSVNMLKKARFFDSSNLGQIERLIGEVDVLQAMRKQPICATVPSMAVRRVFDELYINIAHLKQLIDTDVDLVSNRWLFKYLTLTLDHQILLMLSERAEQHTSSPISINLNVKTLMSDVFQAFDASLRASSKVSVVLEVQASDIFEDMYAFISARDYVQKMGYRLCLDGVTEHSFPMINRALLEVDLIKLQWNANEASNPENKAIAEAVKRCGANRVILTRCDNRQAVEYGQAFGISLFQGRYLDELIDPTRTVQN
ncbi:MAG: EAL domain-containing protein [Alphaproteobacteria bacterium]|nr:MAG: EAL domain-containing protein [Alphaproteobacteria bacterium]